MLIKSQLTQEDFININMVLLYKKSAVKILTVLMLIFLFVSVLTAAFLPEASYSQAIVPIVMLLALPLMTYLAAKRNYAADQRIGEVVEYEFSPDYFLIKGESFNSQLSWNKIYKVTQTKKWLLVWQNAQLATPIPNRDIFDGELHELKKILNNHSIKNNLS